MPIVNVTDIFEKGAKPTLPFEQTVDALIEGYPCIAFSKSYCPYNAAVKDLLALKYGVLLLVIDINQAGSAKDIQRYLCSKTGIATVPQVFLDGQYLGNHDSIMELHAKGLLYLKLGKNAKKDGTVDSSSPSAPCESMANSGTNTYQPLFWFPSTINKWAIRATGLLSCTVSSILATLMFLKQDNSVLVDLLALALFGDFLLRLFSGSQFAPIAQLGGKLAKASKLTPIPRPGAPKQFASFCGTMFSGLGALCYIQFESPIAGGVFLVILAVCTGMEGALDFCLGCKFFAIGEYLLSEQQKSKNTPPAKRTNEKELKARAA